MKVGRFATVEVLFDMLLVFCGLPGIKSLNFYLVNSDCHVSAIQAVHNIVEVPVHWVLVDGILAET